MSSSGVTYIVWGALGASIVALEVSARLRRSRLVPFSQVARPLLSYVPVRGGLLVIWMWAGWHVFAR